MTSPLLILDDVGQEKGSTWVWEQLYILINRRYETLLPTIFTTNLDPGQWTSRWGGAIASRITGMSLIIPLKGIDYRSKKK
jgi:DNA replication protein DnaC